MYYLLAVFVVVSILLIQKKVRTSTIKEIERSLYRVEKYRGFSMEIFFVYEKHEFKGVFYTFKRYAITEKDEYSLVLKFHQIVENDIPACELVKDGFSRALK